MPFLSFASNFLWVMVIGLLGPSLPAILTGLGISYAQAGFFFTLLSLGSLIGSSLGAIGSDYLPRRILFAGCIVMLAIGLSVLGFTRTYAMVALLIFLLSLLGSPIGAIGQSIMLDMFPEKREKYLSLQTFFGAIGSLCAPIVVSVNYTASLSWRWPFVETAVLALVLFVALMAVRIPPLSGTRERRGILDILRNRRVASCAILIFLSVAADLGFSYWLAEYFKTELHVDLRLSSSVVGIYLVGICAGRLLVPVFLKRMHPRTNLILGLSTAFACIVPFILVPWVPVKAALCAVYGFGIGPVFPLLMARGSREFPSQPGSVTGVLFGCLSLGGMVFPLLIGSIAAKVGIARSYSVCAAVVCGLLLAVAFGEGGGSPGLRLTARPARRRHA